MGEYYSYSTIVAWMKRIADRMPEIARVVDIGTSTEGRNIIGLQVSASVYFFLNSIFLRVTHFVSHFSV